MSKRKIITLFGIGIGFIVITILIVFFSSFFYQFIINSKAGGGVYTVGLKIGDSKKSISKNIWGMNFWMFQKTPEAVDSLVGKYNIEGWKKLGIKIVRFGGDDNNPIDKQMTNGKLYMEKYKAPVPYSSYLLTPTPLVTMPSYSISLKDMLIFTESMGAELMYLVNTNYDPNKGIVSGGYSAYPISIPYDITARKNILKNDLLQIVTTYKNKIHYYELGNEPWGPYDPTAHIQFSKELAQVIKGVDPHLQVGIVGYPSSGNNITGTSSSADDQNWTNLVRAAISEKACVYQNTPISCFDFVTDHPYAYAGYNSPKSWVIPQKYDQVSNRPTIFPESKMPDSVNEYLPKNQYLITGFLNESGTEGYVRQCALSYQKAGAIGTDCTNFQKVPYTQLRGSSSPTESYKGVSMKSFFKEGKEMLRQSFLDADGQQIWYRNCPINPSASIYANYSQCEPWKQSLGATSQSSTGKLLEYDILPFTNNVNQQLIRVRILTDEQTPTIKERYCDFKNGILDAKKCSAWTALPDINAQIRGTLRGIDSFMLIGRNEAGTGPTNKYVRNYYVYNKPTGGTGLYTETCNVSLVNTAIDIGIDQSSKSTKHPLIDCFSKEVLDNTTYKPHGIPESFSIGSLYSYVFYSNVDFSSSFHYNIPGIAAIYGVKEGAERMVSRMADYSPFGLSYTEWNLKCWGGGKSMNRSNMSAGTVDHGFYVLETLLEASSKGLHSAFIHDNNLTNGCGLFSLQNKNTYRFNPAGEAFALTSVVAGGNMLEMVQISSNMPSPTSIPKIPTCQSAVGCVRGGYPIAPYSFYAADIGRKTYVFLLNRHTEMSGQFIIDTSKYENEYKTVTLDSVKQFDSNEWTKREEVLQFRSGLTVLVPPVSVVRVELTKRKSQSPPQITITPVRTEGIITLTPMPKISVTLTVTPQTITPTNISKPTPKRAPTLIFPTKQIEERIATSEGSVILVTPSEVTPLR